jgi:hypothetical protein
MTPSKHLLSRLRSRLRYSASACDRPPGFVRNVPLLASVSLAFEETESDGTLKLEHEDYPAEQHDADEHSRLVLEAMRHLADEQQARAERVRSSARNTFIYLSALFTVAQAVALGEFGESTVSDAERKWIVYVGVAAAAALALTGVITIVVDRLRRVPDIAPGDLEREADIAIDNDEFVADRFTKLYKATARERAAAIEERSPWLLSLTLGAVATVLIVVAEIVISLLARVA